MPNFSYIEYLANPSRYEGSELKCISQIERNHRVAAVHTQGVDPSYLFENYRTAEGQEYQRLRESVINETKVTLGEFRKFISNLSESLHWSTVKFVFGEQDEKKFNEHLKKTRFWDEVQSDLITRQLDTPNDFLVTMPTTVDGKISTKTWIVRAADVIKRGEDFLHFTRKSDFTDAGDYWVSKTEALRTDDIEKDETDESRYYYKYEIPLTVNPFVQFGGVPVTSYDYDCQKPEPSDILFPSFKALMRQLPMYIGTVLTPSCAVGTKLTRLQVN